MITIFYILQILSATDSRSSGTQRIRDIFNSIFRSIKYNSGDHNSDHIKHFKNEIETFLHLHNQETNNKIQDLLQISGNLFEGDCVRDVNAKLYKAFNFAFLYRESINGNLSISRQRWFLKNYCKAHLDLINTINECAYSSKRND